MAKPVRALSESNPSMLPILGATRDLPGFLDRHWPTRIFKSLRPQPFRHASDSAQSVRPLPYLPRRDQNDVVRYVVSFHDAG